MAHQDLQIIKANAMWTEPLSIFFQWLKDSGEIPYFSPHPFTREMAQYIARHKGKDLYYLLVDDLEILGYGMLRGWDEGYRIPSLGIFIHPNVRKSGFGQLMMHFLHAVAKYKGSPKVRLTVHPENRDAVRLYKKFGYHFTEEYEGRKVGFLNL